MLKNKKILAVIGVLVLVVIGVLVVVLSGRGTKEEKSDEKIEVTTRDELKEMENADDPGYNDSGLDVSSGEVDEIDGSGNWESKEENSQSKESNSEDDKKDNQSDDKQDTSQDKDNADNKDTSKDDKKDEDSGNMSDQDVLVDDKTWGKID